MQPHKPSPAKLVWAVDVAGHRLRQHEGVRQARERPKRLCEATIFACEYGGLNTGAVKMRATVGEFHDRPETNAPGMLIPGVVLIGG